MIRYYVFRDHEMVGSAPDREQAVILIRLHQLQDPPHYILRSSYSIIAGEEEYIDYPDAKEAARLAEKYGIKPQR